MTLKCLGRKRVTPLLLTKGSPVKPGMTVEEAGMPDQVGHDGEEAGMRVKRSGMRVKRSG